MRDLLLPECIPPEEDVVFGYNVTHTSKANAKALVVHWIQLGFLEFRKVWRNGKLHDPLPAEDRWHMLGDGVDHDGAERVARDGRVGPAAAGLSTSKMSVFGSRGPMLPVAILNPDGFEKPIRDPDIIAVSDPSDMSPIPMPPHNPANPQWTPPSVVPNTGWARGQYVRQVVREIGGAEMNSITQASLAMVSCPVRHLAVLRDVRGSLYPVGSQLCFTHASYLGQQVCTVTANVCSVDYRPRMAGVVFGDTVSAGVSPEEPLEDARPGHHDLHWLQPDLDCYTGSLTVCPREGT